MMNAATAPPLKLIVQETKDLGPDFETKVFKDKDLGLDLKTVSPDRVQPDKSGEAISDGPSSSAA